MSKENPARGLGETGQAPNRQELGGTGQAPNRQELGGTGQAPNRQEVELQAAVELRLRAEQRAAQTPVPRLLPATLEEAERLVHELRVHQLELEMQNEELRRAQVALENARTRYFALYELAPVGYLSLNEHSLVLEANLRACTLLDLQRTSLVKHPLTRFILEEDQDLYYLRRRQLFATGEDQVYELRMKHPDGTHIWTRIEACLGPSEESEEALCRLTLSDITEEKRLSTQVALSDRLSCLGLLAASMGHEVNNPLTYVLYNVETLAEELGTLAQRLIPPDTVTAQTAEGLRWLRSLAEIPVELREMSEFAEFAAEGARRICELVKSLRTFSRLDEAQNESLSLNDALETALSMTAKELSVRARVVRKLGLLPNVSAKQGELCQVFINLLVNASQAIEEGHVDANEIFVRTWSDDGEVFAAISDTGVGISADKLDKVFEPFFTTKPIGSGTGLGLSICTKLASSFGGRLSVKSKPRVGTTFTLSLPAVAPLAARAGPVDLDEEPLAVCASLRGRILVIDDEPIVRKVLDELLRAHDTVLAATGTEARGILLEDTAFDVILCDLMMPDLSGMELFAWLKVRDPLAAQRVVFITGGAFTPKTQAFLAAVNQPVIDKPFNPRSLRATVATLVHTARQGSSMESPA